MTTSITLVDALRELGKVKDNPKIELRDTGKYGLGVFVIEDITQREFISSFEGGRVIVLDKNTDISNNPPLRMSDHTLQFSEDLWVYNDLTLAQYLNHSCDPNCGIKGLFSLVAMRDIRKGEELTWDYEMTEDSDWRMDCRCGSKSCRKIIGAYKNMPKEVRGKYKGYISEWLIKKYGEFK